MGNWLCCCDEPKDRDGSYSPIPLEPKFPAVYGDNIYDLHGFRERDALKKVKQVIRETKKEVRQACEDISVEFITGRGKHSKNHIPVIRKAVIDHLQSENYYWKYGDSYHGSVIVRIPFQG